MISQTKKALDPLVCIGIVEQNGSGVTAQWISYSSVCVVRPCRFYLAYGMRFAAR